jgi:hypothetical protein
LVRLKYKWQAAAGAICSLTCDSISSFALSFFSSLLLPLPSLVRNPSVPWLQDGGAYGFDGSDFVEVTNATIVVTIQYRLNIFGFLGSDNLRSRDSSNSTGNYGYLPL